MKQKLSGTILVISRASPPSLAELTTIALLSSSSGCCIVIGSPDSDSVEEEVEAVFEASDQEDPVDVESDEVESRSVSTPEDCSSAIDLNSLHCAIALELTSSSFDCNFIKKNKWREEELEEHWRGNSF